MSTWEEDEANSTPVDGIESLKDTGCTFPSGIHARREGCCIRCGHTLNEETS